jgi:hypothetical protein
MKRPPLVEITWYDACSPDNGGWIDIPDLDKWQRGVLCSTVGFIIGRDKKHIRVAASVNFDITGKEVQGISGTFVIPAGMIGRVRRLK